MTNKSISVFFPVYNEKDNIRRLITNTKVVLDKISSNYEIIIVDDGSTDGTSAISEELSQTYQKIRVIHHPKNLGYGAALRTGFVNAKNELIIFTDSDLQFKIDEIPMFIEASTEYDCVIGYRINRADGFRRKFYANGWMFLVHLLFGLKVRDLDCGFKLIAKKVMDKVHFVSKGAVSTTEILVQIKRMGVPIKEIGVTHLPRHNGKQSGDRYEVILVAFWELIKLFIKLTKLKNKS